MLLKLVIEKGYITSKVNLTREKMRRKSVFVLTFILATLMMVIFSTSAKTPSIYSASGNLCRYQNVVTSKIHRGCWSVEVIGDELTFRGYYWEKNLFSGPPENSPVGSIDLFLASFTADQESINIDGDTLTVEGTLHFWKWWMKQDGTREWVEQEHTPAIITVNSNEIYIEISLGPFGQDKSIIGTTLKIEQ